MYYSVCASALFHGTPIAESLAYVRQAGASAYEIWGWWDDDLDQLAAAQQEQGLRLTAMCTRFVPLTDPAQRDKYIAGLRESIAAAGKLGCPTLISQVGADQPHLSREAQHQSIVDGLRACAPLLEEAGVTLVIEPLNVLVDHPGYYLTSSAEAYDIVRQVGSPRVKVLFDVYHQQITEGNLIANITAGKGLIGHVHIAGVPGRHEVLGECEINYAAVLAALEKTGYQEAIGLEYFPKGDAMESIRELIQRIPL